MRANTQALMSDPRFTIRETPKDGKWAFFSANSPREMHLAAMKYARTENETSWCKSRWAGLNTQSFDDFDSTGIATHARDSMKKATATLVRKPSRAGKTAPAITGGTWSTPAVLANLPLAAIARQRTKLPPVRLDLLCSWSGSVDADRLTTHFAKLARSIWDYTLAGGAVTLTVHSISKANRAKDGIVNFCASTRIPVTDIAQLALALSPVFMRAVCFPLGCAYSEAPRDSLHVPPERPIPGAVFIGGYTRDGNIGAALADSLKQLQVA